MTTNTQYREQLIRRLRGPAPSIPAMREAAVEIERLSRDFEDQFEVILRLQDTVSRLESKLNRLT